MGDIPFIEKRRVTIWSKYELNCLPLKQLFRSAPSQNALYYVIQITIFFLFLQGKNAYLFIFCFIEYIVNKILQENIQRQ